MMLLNWRIFPGVPTLLVVDNLKMDGSIFFSAEMIVGLFCFVVFMLTFFYFLFCDSDTGCSSPSSCRFSEGRAFAE